jgi:5-methylcytosine-specific restriction protein A
MLNFIKDIKDKISGKIPKGHKRSPKWRKLEGEFSKIHKDCKFCGSKKKLQVHHMKPFHLYPELELEVSNLIMLCLRCHLLFGHLGNFRSYNPEIEVDSEVWSHKITNRPK